MSKASRAWKQHRKDINKNITDTGVHYIPIYPRKQETLKAYRKVRRLWDRLSRSDRREYNNLESSSGFWRYLREYEEEVEE